MLKNKFLIIILLLAITLTAFVPVVSAEEIALTQQNNNPEPVVAPVNENTTNIPNQNSTTENLKKQDVFLTGKDIVIDYLIDGNLFVLGDNVTIKSQIGGDAFIIANNITIENKGYIFSNLFACSTNLKIDGIVCDVYSIADKIDINGYIFRNANLNCSSLNLSGTIGRDLKYTSNTKFDFSENSIKGNIVHKEISPISKQENINSYLISLGTTVATISLVWAVCLWLAPKFLKTTSTIITKKLPQTIGLGILAPIAIVVLTTILIILTITIPIGFLALTLFMFLLFTSTSIFVITINNLICKKLKIEKNHITFGILVAVSIVYWLISIIPYVGTFINLIAMITGLGIVIYYIFNKNKNINDTSKEKPKAVEENK